MLTIKTGDTLAAEVTCFLLFMPRENWFKQAILSTLLQATNFDSWKQFGTVTIDRSVEAANEMLEGMIIMDFNPFPPGKLEAFAGATIPTGWLLCDGASKATVDYPELFAAIGYIWGGSGANFNVPDYRDKVIVGAGETFALTDSGGETDHTLTTAETPSHSHDATVFDSGHVHEEVAAVPIAILEGEIPFPGAAVPTPSVTGLSFTGVSVSNAATGGDGSHNNMQPYASANIIIFAGR